MSRRMLGPRLFLHRRKGRPAVWTIRHAGKMFSTGFAEDMQDEAMAALRAYAATAKAFAEKTVTRTPPSLKSVLYFVTCDLENFPVKIGSTRYLPSRLKGIQTSLPYRVVVLAAVPGTEEDEKRLHSQFAPARLRGEWFRRTPEIMKHVDHMRGIEQHYAYMARTAVPTVTGP